MLAPCINQIDVEVSQKIRDQAKDFLKSNNQKVIAAIKEKMLLASAEMDYESAAEYKKMLAAIEHINIKQNIEVFDNKDRDIFAYTTREGYLSLGVLLFRKGTLFDKKTYIVEQFASEDEQVANLILQFYQKVPLPQEVIINNKGVITLLDGLLDAKVYRVTRGKLIDLTLTAKQNADNAIDEYFLSARLDADKLSLLEKLGELLNIKTPLRIELFDNSHLQGSSPVGALVVFINGEPAKKLYRKYKIEHGHARDDLKSMEEIVYRRYLRLKNERQVFPDLILVDGGLNQISAAHKSLKKIKVNIPLYGLVKNNKHQTSGLMDQKGRLYPIEDKNLFFLLTRMQDEVHRFAITFHKSLRSKKMKSSLLDGIKGLGSKRKEMLNKAYPDINLLKQASIEQLNQLLPKEVALALYAKLHE
ncbi:MAG: excinuclease ABC subunit C [Erysipelotrichia bacterium]|nr:excinuclease ABC subunit C [Erysipelotrichia bacterium]